MPQSFAKIIVHLIFSTKDRRPIIDHTWRSELHTLLGGLVNQSGGRSVIVGGVSDHVHLLFDLGRKISIADLVRVLKSTTTPWVTRDRAVDPTFSWQQGYAAFSVSESNIASVTRYIAQQEEHHRIRTFQDELREWLKKQKMEWDERYIWD